MQGLGGKWVCLQKGVMDTFSVFTVSLSMPVCDIVLVLKDITTGRKWIKGIQDGFVLFLKTTCESTIFPKSLIKEEYVIFL